MEIRELEITAEVKDATGVWRKVSTRVSLGSPLGESLIPHIEEEAHEAGRDYGWIPAS